MATAINEHTLDSIRTKFGDHDANKAYKDSWERTFGKKNKEEGHEDQNGGGQSGGDSGVGSGD